MIFLSIISDLFNGVNDTIETIIGGIILIIGGGAYAIYVFFRNRKRTKENPDWKLEEEIDEAFESINENIAELEGEDLENMSQSPKECFKEIKSSASSIKMKFLKFKSQEHKNVYKENYEELLNKVDELQKTYDAKGLYDKFNTPELQRSRIVKQLNEKLSMIESDLSKFLTRSKEEGRDLYIPEFSDAESLLSSLKSISKDDANDVVEYSRRIAELKNKYEAAQGQHLGVTASNHQQRTGVSNTSQAKIDEHIRRKKIMSQHGIEVKLDGSWGPWLQKQWDLTKQKYNVE